MPGAHRDQDGRKCGAKTIVTVNTSVKVNGKLWAIEDNECDHTGGPLKPVVGDSVKVHGVKVIVFGDEAKSPDNSGHNPTSETIPEEKSDNVFAYGQG